MDKFFSRHTKELRNRFSLYRWQWWVIYRFNVTAIWSKKGLPMETLRTLLLGIDIPPPANIKNLFGRWLNGIYKKN
jgi:hypothetical protein